MSYGIPLEKTLKDIAKAIREGAGHYDLSDYKAIVAAIRTGHGELIPNGTCFQVPHAVYGNIDFVTRRQNVDKVVGEPDRPTITIQTKYALSVNAGTSAASFQYDRPEAFKKVAETIAAGSVVKFSTDGYDKWTSGVKHFTATNEIPAGSMLCISGYAYQSDLTAQKVVVYANQKASSPLAQYDIVDGEGGATVDLGAWGNHAQRVSYGSNNEKDSNIFQFLNGDSGTGFMDSIWTPQSDYDMMSTSFASLKGFLGGFPADFRECLGLCAIHNVTNTVYEEPGYTKNSDYVHNGYFWLPSRKEIYGSNETSSEDSESQLPYYANIGTTNADKLAYAKGASSPVSEWLRTPDAGYAFSVRFVHAGNGGALSTNYANVSYAVRPLAILA